MFLEIITRHLTTRPIMLTQQQASLAILTDSDWMQTLLIDDIGRGVPWANANLAICAPRLAGDYIWILDDDDLCIYPPLVNDLKAIVAKRDPDVVFVRMDHGADGILPDDENWGHAPVYGHIGTSAFIVRRSIWQAHACAWVAVRESDYTFIAHVWAAGPRVYWHDVIASRIQRCSEGRPD